MKSGISLYSLWAGCRRTRSALRSDYFCVFTYQWWNYLLPATQSVTQRQRYCMCVSVDIISTAASTQVHTNMTDNHSSINAAYSSFPLFPCLHCVIRDILPSAYSFFPPSFHLLRLWTANLGSKCIHRANIIHCF